MADLLGFGWGFLCSVEELTAFARRQVETGQVTLAGAEYFVEAMMEDACWTGALGEYLYKNGLRIEPGKRARRLREADVNG